MRTAIHAEQDMGTLVRACTTGDEEAWRVIVETLSPLVWTVARSHRLQPTDCQDVYQATWMRAVQHLHKLHSPDRITSWIVTAARRESLKHIQRSPRHVLVADDGVFDSAGHGQSPGHGQEAPDAIVVRQAGNAEVAAALRKLPSRDQELLGMLMEDPPRSYNEVSRAMGIPRGSVGPLRQRALSRLRALLA
jgi:RNA polymerase sigma factor (sigma-70 family)